MEWGKLAMASGAVYVLLFVIGFLISILSSWLQCDKTSIGTSLYQGLFFGSGPTLAYALASAFTSVRNPFGNTFASFGISTVQAPVYGVAYLVMLFAWVFSVWIIHSTEKTVCVTSNEELNEFKRKLLGELQQKEDEKEANANKKTT